MASLGEGIERDVAEHDVHRVVRAARELLVEPRHLLGVEWPDGGRVERDEERGPAHEAGRSRRSGRSPPRPAGAAARERERISRGRPPEARRSERASPRGGARRRTRRGRTSRGGSSGTGSRRSPYQVPARSAPDPRRHFIDRGRRPLMRIASRVGADYGAGQARGRRELRLETEPAPDDTGLEPRLRVGRREGAANASE
jgi:hypothetical protein